MLIKIKQKLILVVFVLLLAWQSRSVKIFLMGGAVANNETQIYIKLAEATGKKPYPNNCSQDWKTTLCPKIAVITSAAPSEQAGNQAFNIDQQGSLSYRSLFLLYGISPKHVSVHVDNYLTTTDLNKKEGQENLQIIKQADIIFFNGGDQSRHARSWLKDNGQYNQIMAVIVQMAEADKVILSGTSAGSMIMCSPIYGSGITYGHMYFAAKVGLAEKKVADGAVNGTTLSDTRNGTHGLQFQDNGGFMPGFKFVPFLSDTHFDIRARLGRIVPALVQLKKDYGVGVDQSTAFYYNNGIGIVYGKNGVFIADITKATLLSKSYFAINNVNVSYLTSGDTYDFNKKLIVAQKSKNLITKPYYSGYSDSTDILKSYQITRLITRLVDQTSTSNVGRSVVQKGYPQDAPKFKLTFLKGNYTVGYWSDTKRKYTAGHVIVNYSYQ